MITLSIFIFCRFQGQHEIICGLKDGNLVKNLEALSGKWVFSARCRFTHVVCMLWMRARALMEIPGVLGSKSSAHTHLRLPSCTSWFLSSEQNILVKYKNVLDPSWSLYFQWQGESLKSHMLCLSQKVNPQTLSTFPSFSHIPQIVKTCKTTY